MDEMAGPPGRQRYHRTLLTIAVAAVVVGLVGIGWGLPAGNQMWAADSVAPMTPLSVAYHVFVEEGFNSGYFYFKYPVGHQLLLAALSAPVVAFAWLRGDLAGISTDYPYGFSNADAYLAALALVARLLSVALAAGLLLTVAGIAHRLADRRAGVMAALVAAGSYPIVFYAHTSNVEVTYLFWAFLALYATIRALQDGQPRWYLLVGAAAAAAVSTKEQIAGFLVALPLVILAVHWAGIRSGARRGLLPAGALGGALAAVGTLLVVNAAFFNPAGFLNRFRFLTHTLSPEVRERYAAYEFPIDFSTDWGFTEEIAHILEALRAVASSIGWPALVLALAGIALMAARHRPALVYVLAPLVTYYMVSLRVLKQVEIRYTMPLSTLLTIPAGIFLAYLWTRGRGARGAVIGLLVAGLVYSGEVLVMLTDDARYEAEAWMQPHLDAGHSVEVFQSWTYLPRWQRTEGVAKPAFGDTTVAGIERRAPEFVVVSSKAREGMVMYPNPDWRDGRGMMLEAIENRRFLTELEAGRLDYRRVAAFERPLLVERELITSLNPEIVVYRRGDGGMTPSP